MLFLVLVTSSLMTSVLHFIKPSLGYFSIPVAVIISLIVVGKLKTALWPPVARPGFFAELSAKLALNPAGTYCFYGILAGITYLGYGKYGFNFNITFALAFFIGMIFEEFYNIVKIYEQKLNVKLFSLIVAWAAICAITSSTIIFVMITVFGFAGSATTIACVILLKLVQPLGSRLTLNIGIATVVKI